MRNVFAKFWKFVRRLGRAWLGGDAIRASPTDRLWLFLETPCQIFWHGERIEVLRRNDATTDDGLVLVYDCQTLLGERTLLVRPGKLHQPPRCEWIEPTKSTLENQRCDAWRK